MIHSVDNRRIRDLGRRHGVIGLNIERAHDPGDLHVFVAGIKIEPFLAAHDQIPVR